jgi:hypothetical protein
MNQDKFIEASTKERELMKKLFTQNNINSYIFTPADGMDREEGYYTATTTSIPYIFEVKNRNITTDTYKTIAIEESKVRYLLEQAKQRNEQAVIFFFFNDGYWMHQPLYQDVYYHTSNFWMPVTTMGRNNEKVLKPCIEFLIDKTKLKRYDA